MIAVTGLLCASGCMAFLLREASGLVIILTARFCMASSLLRDVSKACHSNR